MSLKPIQENISHLDRFIKDLIHDLNTPVSSIILNLKLIKNSDDEKLVKPINRIDQSVRQITSLYDNLEIIIKKTLKKQKVDLYEIFEQKQSEIKLLYPNIKFIIQNKPIIVNTNKASIIRILDNILSNSCKYSNIDPFIKIEFRSNTLMIQDNGKGMKYPQKIFERSYSENENGHGIGMHIVQRLCYELDIDIQIDSKEEIGTIIKLHFN
jgi:two-component system OmpR family sensor kinase